MLPKFNKDLANKENKIGDTSQSSSFGSNFDLGGGGDSDYYKKKEGYSITSIVSVLIFVLSIVSYAGSYGYNVYLENQVEILGAGLVEVRDNFEPEKIQEILSFNDTVDSLKLVGDNRFKGSLFFEKLEGVIATDIVLNNLSFNRNLDGYLLSFTANAGSINLIINQISFFNNDPIFNKIRVNSVQRQDDDSGLVSYVFSATGIFDPVELSLALNGEIDNQNTNDAVESPTDTLDDGRSVDQFFNNEDGSNEGGSDTPTTPTTPAPPATEDETSETDDTSSTSPSSPPTENEAPTTPSASTSSGEEGNTGSEGTEDTPSAPESNGLLDSVLETSGDGNVEEDTTQNAGSTSTLEEQLPEIDTSI